MNIVSQRGIKPKPLRGGSARLDTALTDWNRTLQNPERLRLPNLGVGVWARHRLWFPLCCLRHRQTSLLWTLVLIAASNYPDNEGALFGRGVAYMNLGDNEYATEDFATCVKVNPWRIELHIQKAMALFQLEKYREADSDIDRALELDATSVEANFCKGVIKLALGEAEVALKSLTRILELE
jgi:tetratricopeptide (TPR) repeat protein